MNLLKRTTALLIATLVLGTAGCSKSSSDGAITARVKTAISSEPGLKGTKVSVNTNEKVVHLSGPVKSRDERAMLIAVARKVEGVKAIKTDLVVPPQQKAAARPQQKTVAKAQQKPGAKPQQKSVVEAKKKRELQAQQRVTPQAEIPGTGR
jgi:hyperosmotically inducible periplasmic protein